MSDWGCAMKLPNNIGELFKAALDIESAKKTVVAVNVFIDEVTSPDFQVFVRSGFNSESPNSRVMISYFPTQTPDVEAPCDIAIIAAGNSVESVALAEGLKSIDVPTLVVTEQREGLVTRASEMGYPLDPENIVSPQTGESFGDEIKEELADAIGKWIVRAAPEKRLAFSIAYPFVRRPLSKEAVFTTAAQNAGVGLVVFVPGADMPIMTVNQAKMVLQIAAAYGHPLGVNRIKELAATLGGALVFRTIARQAVGLVPALGWAIKAGMGYAGTVAIGNTAIDYFENGGDVAGLASVVGHARDSVFKAALALKKKPSFKQAAYLVSDKAHSLADVSLQQAVPVIESATKTVASSIKPGMLRKKKK